MMVFVGYFGPTMIALEEERAKRGSTHHPANTIRQQVVEK